mmetsp:Transcript_4097/g.6071  ORF Transcript_4097/g.6071 Transcript_4097/m.6071 type:complete len:253 (-) Transcript_4097:1390-2148(-)
MIEEKHTIRELKTFEKLIEKGIKKIETTKEYIPQYETLKEQIQASIDDMHLIIYNINKNKKMDNKVINLWFLNIQKLQTTLKKAGETYKRREKGLYRKYKRKKLMKEAEEEEETKTKLIQQGATQATVNSLVRNTLQRTQKLLSTEVGRMDTSLGSMQEQTERLTQLLTTQNDYEATLSSASHTVTQLKRRELFDKMVNQIGFYFFLSVVAYLLHRRFPIILWIVKLIYYMLTFWLPTTETILKEEGKTMDL